MKVYVKEMYKEVTGTVASTSTAVNALARWGVPVAEQKVGARTQRSVDSTYLEAAKLAHKNEVEWKARNAKPKASKANGASHGQPKRDIVDVYNVLCEIRDGIQALVGDIAGKP